MSGPADADPERPAAATARTGPLLALLNKYGVDYVVIGAVAAAARGAGLDPPHDLAVTPDAGAGNLARLADALAHAGAPRLRSAGAPVPVRPSAELFPHIPMLALATDLGEVTVALEPPGFPVSFADLAAECTEVDVDGVTVRVPSVEALLRGLAGGGAAPSPGLLQALRSAPAAPAAGTQPGRPWCAPC